VIHFDILFPYFKGIVVYFKEKYFNRMFPCHLHVVKRLVVFINKDGTRSESHPDRAILNIGSLNVYVAKGPSNKRREGPMNSHNKISHLEDLKTLR
jgi:hypothetical protein